MPRVLRTLHGVVEAPIDDVAAVVLDVPASGGGVSVEIDRAARTVALQGGWWYRGETALAVHPRGTAVTYRILDVAPQGRWSTYLVSFRTLRAAPEAFAAQLAEVGARLGVPSYPVTAA